MECGQDVYLLLNVVSKLIQLGLFRVFVPSEDWKKKNTFGTGMG